VSLIGFSGSLGHFGEDLLDFAEEEDEVVLLDFPELLVFSSFLCVGALGRNAGRSKRGKERITKVGLSAANGWTHEQKLDYNIDQPSW